MTHRYTDQLSKKDNVKNVLLVVLTSDRGLCGGFNSNINKFAERYIAENKSKLQKLDLVFVGKRGLDYFARKKVTPIDSYLKLDKEISYNLAKTVAEKLVKFYLDGQYDEIRLVYNEFKSAIAQQVVAETLLPIEADKTSFDTVGNQFAKDMIFDPSPEIIVGELLKKYFNLTPWAKLRSIPVIKVNRRDLRSAIAISSVSTAR